MAKVVNECQLAGRPEVTELHMMLLLLLQRHFIILTARRPTERPTDSVHRICPIHRMIIHSFNFVSIMRARLPRFFLIWKWFGFAGKWIGEPEGGGEFCEAERSGAYAPTVEHRTSISNFHAARAIFSLPALLTAAPFFPSYERNPHATWCQFWYTWA